MKRILIVVLCLALLSAALFSPALAEGAGWYVVDSQSPKGYCYLYTAASSSSSKSRNLGRYDNGEYVYVIEYNGGNGYCRVQTQDGKTGYIGAKALRRYYGDVWADSAPGWFLVASRNPVGYCYLYTAASSSSSKSRNLGRHDNGEQVYVLSRNAGNGFSFVRTEEGETGYMASSALLRVSDIEADPTSGWYMVASAKRSYCYLYTHPSSSGSKTRNLGRHDNGEWVYVVDYEGENGYSFVFTEDGETGFMDTGALMKY